MVCLISRPGCSIISGGPLVEKSGSKIEDIPQTWGAGYDFFKDAQKKLRAIGERKVYGMGFTLSSVGVDTVDQFNAFHSKQVVMDIDGTISTDVASSRTSRITTTLLPWACLWQHGKPLRERWRARISPARRPPPRRHSLPKAPRMSRSPKNS
jgi:hypothetical protein